MSMLAQLPRVPVNGYAGCEAGCEGISCEHPFALLVLGLPSKVVEPLLSLACLRQCLGSAAQRSCQQSPAMTSSHRGCGPVLRPQNQAMHTCTLLTHMSDAP